MTGSTMGARQMIQRIRHEMRSQTGRDYRIDWARLDTIDLREFLRFLQDVETNRAISFKNYILRG